jgi:hypothetical protein
MYEAVIMTIHLHGEDVANLEAIKLELPLATTHAVTCAATRVGLRIFRSDAAQAAAEMIRAKNTRRGGGR